MDSYGQVGLNADPFIGAPLYVYSSGTRWSHCILAGTVNSLGTAFGMNYKYATKGDGFYVNSQWLYSHGSYLGSDSTLKQNMSTIADPLTFIGNLRGIRYKWKPNSNALAHDVCTGQQLSFRLYSPAGG